MATPSFSIVRGDDKILELTFKDPDTNTPIDLTGCVVFFTVKVPDDNTENDDNAVLKKSQAVHQNAVGGVTTFPLTHADTAPIEPGVYDYDFQIVDSQGSVLSVEYSTLEVKKDITRRIS